MKNPRGFTLLEILMTLVLVGILGAVAISTLTSSVSNESFDATVAEMNLIRNAIIGDASELTRGVRTSFGYHGDVGALPAALGDLLTLPGGVTASTVSSANRTVFGWNGPYLPTSDPAADYTRDGWGNLYVWSPAAGTPTLVSLGSDGAVGGVGLAQDITMEFPVSVRRATVNGFITSTGAGTAITSAASVTLYYPNGTGGTASTVIAVPAASPGGAFAAANIPFGVRSLTFTVAGVPYGPVIFNVDRANYTVPLELTQTGNPCPTQTIQFSLASSSGIETTTSFNIVVEASATCTSAMTVDYVLADGTAVAPGDYTAASGTLTIPAGSTTVNLPITIINDATFEVTETFTATLSNPSTGLLGANTVHTRSITNDDATPCVADFVILNTSQTWAVPAGCTSLVVKSWGGGGGRGQTSNGKSGTGGSGGYAYTNALVVTPGETFTIVVGEGGSGDVTCGVGGAAGAYTGGTPGNASAGGVGAGGGGGAGGAGGAYAGGAGGFGGGGGGSGSTAGDRGGGGGGATSVTRNSGPTVILVAGGGGGGGGGDNGGGGNAGNGGPGCAVAGSASGSASRGGGGGGGRCTGTNTANGAGRTPSNSAEAGTNGVGGNTGGGNCAAWSGSAGAVRFDFAP